MPIYEYQCRKCGKNFEVLQSISSEPLGFCPEEYCDQDEKAKGEVFRKISGGSGLVFNGSGFYLTDYVKKGDSSES
ncbi:MAG: zinc ribbon domain-containing protein [Ignavibacteria bacterium]|jgi:putative FmdB family regulatory protein|nr:zinc ribbon domain-containing protein [Ignavibacteria bacterium]